MHMTYRGPRPLPPAFEPTIEDILADPIVGLLLRRDGLTVGDVRVTLEHERRRLRAGRHAQTAPPRAA